VVGISVSVSVSVSVRHQLHIEIPVLSTPAPTATATITAVPTAIATTAAAAPTAIVAVTDAVTVAVTVADDTQRPRGEFHGSKHIVLDVFDDTLRTATAAVLITIADVIVTALTMIVTASTVVAITTVTPTPTPSVAGTPYDRNRRGLHHQLHLPIPYPQQAPAPLHRALPVQLKQLFFSRQGELIVINRPRKQPQSVVTRGAPEGRVEVVGRPVQGVGEVHDGLFVSAEVGPTHPSAVQAVDVA
jgi:TRAP-type C4-dicarboxylate transport system permease small subunit